MGNRKSRETRLALCCECGAQRKVTEWDSWGEASPEQVANPRQNFGRCFVWRKCYFCEKETRHAYLREGEGRDEIESTMLGVDAVRTAETYVAESQIPDILQWMHDHDVRVRWKHFEPDTLPHGKLIHYLDDGVFLLILDPESESLTLTKVLQQAVSIIKEPQAWPIWFVQPANGGHPPIAFLPLSLTLDRKST